MEKSTQIVFEGHYDTKRALWMASGDYFVNHVNRQRDNMKLKDIEMPFPADNFIVL